MASGTGSVKWTRAKFPGFCRTCDERVRVGQQVGRWGGQWQHRECVEIQRQVGAILEGETFAGTSPTYRRKRRRQ